MRMGIARMDSCVVIAGLDPAIHATAELMSDSGVKRRYLRYRPISMDHRVKPGGDE